MTNYFDKQGNYINCENLSLAEIYHRAFALGVESTPIEDKRPQGEWVRKEDILHYIATQYSEHNELVPIWLRIGDFEGGAE